jgi:glucosamine--fructose-6-phosphate aminotransferase (isomerizing)
MCGIFGCILRDGTAGPVMRQALERLEYRGYDSVGQATVYNNELLIKKDKGKLAEVHARINLDDMLGTIGIAHTRWATHGAPSKENAHPHTDCHNKIAIIHNGIIENFMELRKRLEGNGHSFRSRTDSEVVAHLIEEQMKEGPNLLAAVTDAVTQLKGAFAIVVLSSADPETIVCARKENPLVIGIGQDATYCASDISAFLPLTNKALLLEEDEIASLKLNKVEIRNLSTGEAVERTPLEITWTRQTAEKSGYTHFMLKEIYEQPQAIRNALRTQRIYYDLVASKIDSSEAVYLIGCGTAYHACLGGSYSFAKLAGLRSQVVIASEFNQVHANLLDSNSTVIALSQSGETADTLNAVRASRARGASVISVTNVMGSTLTRLSDVYIGQNSGPEIGVAATKTFTAQLTVLTRLAIVLAEKRGKMSSAEAEDLLERLEEVPDQILTVLKKQDSRVREIARKYKDRPSLCFLGRGINEVTAIEGRLKLLEIAYIPSLAYAAGESKHGFIAIVEPGYPVVFSSPKDETHGKIIGNVMEMKARGANIISIIEEGDEQIRSISDDFIEMPAGIPSIMTPLVYIVPLQLLAYYVSVEKGYDPDHPRNLAKSVTVE